MSRDTRKCIKDFVRHLDSLEAETDPEGNGFNREYRLIHEVQVKNRRDNVFQMTAGKADNNLKKNRYKDILPYDEHRVLLSPKDGEENSDYINASRLTGVKGTAGYVASQGPLASTVDDYWRMIWEYNVEIVFMACRIVELGKIKCKQYWNDVDKSDDFGDITVFTEAEEEISSDFIRRKFRVTRDKEERHVTQFHYLGWPDHGIPDDPAHIRDLISITRQTRQNDQVPLLVHCSAGCGRTGAIVAIDFVWTLLEQGKFDESFSLYDLICSFREQRMSMVQTADQYALVNKVLKSLCEEWLDKMASHTYVNVELKDAADKGDGLYENAVLVDPSKTDTGPGPEVLNLSPPSYMAPKPPTSPTSAQSSSYENVVILPERTPAIKGTEAAEGNEEGETNRPTLHKTVIQLGSGAAATAASAPSKPLGGPEEVINFVRGGSSRSLTSSTSSGMAHSTSPTSPVESQKPMGQEVFFADGPVYATVNKGGNKAAPQVVKVQSTGISSTGSTSNKSAPSSKPKPKILVDHGGYSVVSVEDSGGEKRGGHGPSLNGVLDSRSKPASIRGGAGAAADTSVYSSVEPLSQVAGNDKSTDHNVRLRDQVSNGPGGSASGFGGERLPRVKGPVSEPASWAGQK